MVKAAKVVLQEKTMTPRVFRVCPALRNPRLLR